MNGFEALLDKFLERKAEELIKRLEEDFPEIFYTNISHTPTFTGNNIKDDIRDVLKFRRN